MGIGGVRDAEGAKRWYWRAAGMYFLFSFIFFSHYRLCLCEG
jgi:hypothetical protein